jgi:hypothetical protein
MELSGDKPRCFTAEFSRRVGTLVTPVRIGEAFGREQSTPSLPQTSYTAIWDTGASNTVITEKVIQECDLKPIGIVEVHTVGGVVNSPAYLVSVHLLNNVVIAQLKVIKGEVKGADILIGMDIIVRGDFAITNKGKKTVFSFRMPSMEIIDFVKKMRPLHLQM